MNLYQQLHMGNLPRLGDIIGYWPKAPVGSFTPEKDFLYFLVVGEPMHQMIMYHTEANYWAQRPFDVQVPCVCLLDYRKQTARFYPDLDTSNSDWILVSRIEDDLT